ncbi:transcription factor TFIIIC subunit TFC7 NDAI_0B04260 [Naumovozyma dairenensis CBS 421]|uniref:Transcription factor TFIIIC triple barrel domain-containing protein n=1 Tax=Naumovozyma dairenensis (strain ATCC 10597 / BCRC 20456 / CBS 421 / NBRC 0211 / NRRL Y-12639) TaxID=1071378 RepID=G0W6P9_NAUDC|nr:hypothetical protein NDAI_0B04260 [Naumovozyma dairenensis CBS 421]CCD23460.1 hypothetical protein NDAI_0B04260 [Naumovozyma dairenensis CBS 421]
MAIKTIYIARHGYRSNWLPHGPYPPPPTGIDSDVPLAEHGLQQARELAHYLLSIENQPELLFTSPFYRCVQTSEPIMNLLEIPMYVDNGIGEWYMPTRPIIPTPANYETLNHFFPGKIQEGWEASIIPSDKGETEDDIFIRCKKFWPIFIDAVEKKFPNVETILLVTHAATKIALGLNLLKLDSCRDPIDSEGNLIRSGSCSLDKYEVKDVSKDENGEPIEDIPFQKRKWTLTMNGNTEFLRNGEEMNWNFQKNVEAGSDADIKARLNKDKESTGTANVVAATKDDDQMETVYVSLDLPNKNYRKKSEIPKDAIFQYSGLEQKHPLIKIGSNVYEGTWKNLMALNWPFRMPLVFIRKLLRTMLTVQLH